MFKRTCSLILLVLCAVFLSLPILAEEGNVFYGRGPFRIRIPWGGDVAYLSYSQSVETLRFVAVGVSANREVFGVVIEGFNFGDAFEDQEDWTILRSLFSLNRKDHIEDTGSDYSAVFSRETSIGDCYAIQEEFEEETPNGLRMRGYSAVFGDRHVCYWMYISSGESDFPYSRDRFDAIIKGITTGDTYPAFVEEIPLALELDEERIPLMLVSVSEEAPLAASFQWDDTGLKIHVTVTQAESASEASVLAGMLGDEMTRIIEEGAAWSSSFREIEGSVVGLHQAETSDDDGDWMNTILSWNFDTEVFVALYRRFGFEYDTSDIEQIVTPFHSDD